MVRADTNDPNAPGEADPMKYKICASNYKDELETQVEAALRDGYELAGGIAAHGARLFQAVYKPAPPAVAESAETPAEVAPTKKRKRGRPRKTPPAPA